MASISDEPSDSSRARSSRRMRFLLWFQEILAIEPFTRPVAPSALN
jgi:hypothetical protein